MSLSLDRSTGDVLLNDLVANLYAASSSAASSVKRQTPVLSSADQSPSSIERFETLLEGEAISCFIVGGEKRLCFPQVLNAVLRDIPYDEINRACADLNINTPLASPAQLETLKLTGVLPRNTASCGLVTKSDAERLVNYLHQIRRPGQRLVPEGGEERAALGIPVRHDCFGGARGLLFPDLYAAPDSACCECHECGHVFRPDKFVVHSHHQGAERRTCHWGFDSGNWRAYLRLQSEAEDRKELVERLSEVKSRHDPQSSNGLLAKSLLTARLSSLAGLSSRLNAQGLKRKAEEEPSGLWEAKRMAAAAAAPALPELYDQSSLLSYYSNLLRYQSLFQQPKTGANAALANLLSLSQSTSSQACPIGGGGGGGAETSSAPSKAALTAVSGLLALSAADSKAGLGESQQSRPQPLVKPQPLKPSSLASALLSPELPRSTSLSESSTSSGVGGSVGGVSGLASKGPLKKQLLHSYAEERRREEEAKEEGKDSARPSSGSVSTSSASEGEEGEISLDRLLEKLVRDPADLAALRAKIAESQRNLEMKIDSLQKQYAAALVQNSSLLQELLQLRAQGKAALPNLLGLNGVLMGH